MLTLTLPKVAQASRRVVKLKKADSTNSPAADDNHAETTAPAEPANV